MNGALPWVIYVRVSTDEQAETGSSLDAQKASCGKMLEAQGITNTIVIDDGGYTGRTLKRPGLQRVLAMAKNREIAGVVVWAITRFMRKTRLLHEVVELLKEHDVAFVSVTENLSTKGPAGDLMLSILGSIAQFESDNIAARVKHCMDFRREQGGFVGGRIPPGCVVTGEKGKRLLVLDPNASPEIRRPWSMILEGRTLRQVCDHLNGLGVRPSSKVKRWNLQNLSHFLRSERVVGLLVDRDMRDRALQSLGLRFSPQRASAGGERIAPAVASERVWRLAKVARCGLCGQAMVGAHARGRHGKLFPYLRCSGKRKGACRAVDLPAVAWEQAVIDCCRKAVGQDGPLMKRITEQRLRHANNAEASTARRGELVMARDRLQGRINRLIELVVEGDAAGKAVAPKLAEIQLEKERVEVSIAECDGILSAAHMTQRDADLLVDRLRNGLDDLPNKSPIEQADALRVLLAEVLVAADRPIELALRVPGTAEGFVHKSRMVHQSALSTNPVRMAFPVTVARRAGKILLQPGTWLGS